MRTIAQKYIEEGEVRGIQIGKEEGIQIGETRGEARGEARLVRMMIKNGSSIKEIAKITRLSVTRINELLKIQF